MTKGHGTCGQPIVGRKRPQRGRTASSLAPVRPLRGRLESVFAIRRFHSLRSFHLRLFTFAPFGDGRISLAKVQHVKKIARQKRARQKIARQKIARQKIARQKIARQKKGKSIIYPMLLPFGVLFSNWLSNS